MKKKDNQLIYSPSDLINFMESSFITWMDRYHLEYPDQLKPDDTDEFVKIQQDKGNKHENNFLNTLKNVTIIPQNNNSNINTKNAMKQQDTEIIYQAHITNENKTNPAKFSGYADFLFKVEGDSKLGKWHYEPWDTKLALKPKPYFIIQLCCYAEMLESIQGIRPKNIHVVFGNDKEKSFNIENYFYYYKQLKNSFIKQQENFDPAKKPDLIGLQNYGRWTSYAEEILKKNDHLSLTANISKSQIKKLGKSGISTLTELANFKGEGPSNIGNTTFTTLKKQAHLQIQSLGKEKPEYEIILPDKNNPRKGLSLLPPASNNDIWFDMESYPFMNGGKKLEYLFGAIYLDQEKPVFKDWWAHNDQQEKEAFKQVVDWIYSRWEKDPAMHIYHYGHYEPTALKSLMGEYGIGEEKIDNLLREEVFVDLYKIVKQSLIIGEPKYSIKNVERLYKKKREAKITKADESIICYEQWLNKCGPEDWTKSDELKKIRNYNQEDCESTRLLCNFLRDIQKIQNINYIPKPIKLPNASNQAEKTQNIKNDISDLSNKLLSELEKNNFATKEEEKLTEIFCHILEFHNREEKPIWWKMFKCDEMTPKELLDDPDCLAGAAKTDRPYEYKFNPNQETKIKEGDQCYFNENGNRTYTNVKKIDYKTGTITLTSSALTNTINLIPFDYVNANVIKNSILQIAKKWSENGKIQSSIKSFLLHDRPNIKGNIDGPIIKNEKNILKESITAISNMDNTTLCIQGPPGSGKTHLAANTIIELISNGKKVGITSNSHKAIDNLLNRVLELQKETIIKPVKIKRNPKTKLNIKYEDSATKVFPNNKYNLIGGTAWAFSNDVAKDQLDYLFVDEAGQVSAANLIGMAHSTKNIILMGDQMQLSQPTKGSHPGDSGLSCMEYLLQGNETIPKNLGIFLDTTYRLHPNIGNFISKTFYEGRLKHNSNNEKNYIVTNDNKLITKDSGILFIPTKHKTNKQKSIEEVEKIKDLINELLTLKYNSHNPKTNNNEIKDITLNDILIMAPYNMQVHEIKKAIPGARVGSVDKFQGQEAPISIISMCTSDANNSPRGLDFIFSKNRLNVALSRAKTLAIVVGNPELVNAPCSTVKQIELVNLYCKILNEKQTHDKQN